MIEWEVPKSIENAGRIRNDICTFEPWIMTFEVQLTVIGNRKLLIW